MGGERLEVGADLVGHVAVGRHPIRAKDDHIHLARAHEMAGGVVRDQVHGDLGPHQFPGREPRPL